VNLPDNLLDDVWCWIAWAIWLPVFIRSLWRAPWRRLSDSDQLNLWLGMIVLLTLIWSMKAGVKPGLSMHLLGASVFTLCFGPALAFIGLSMVLLGITLNGAAGGFAFALNSLLVSGSAIFFSQLITQTVNRRLPSHFFIFIFVNGFFGSALMVLGVGFVLTSFMAVSGVYELDYLLAEYLPYFILLGFSEAWLSGMIMTLFVIYRPEWVASFDDTRYLSGK
jgi:uncharacterized membrane protein